MKTLTSFYLLVFSVLYFGCESETPADNGLSIQSLFPMAVGNEWVLANTEYDDTGLINGRDTVRIRLDSAGTINGHAGFYLTSPDNDLIFLYYAGNTIVQVDVERNISRESLRFPKTAGEEITVHDTLHEDGYRFKETVRFVSTRVPVSVPAGSFDALHFEQMSMSGQDGDLDTVTLVDMFMVPNVGLVYQRYYDMPGRTLMSKQELLSYTIQ
jgi:hypothetical protein